MKYTSEKLASILSAELGLKLENEIFDYEISVNPITAFEYAIFTGSGYLYKEEPELRVIIKRDFFRVFNQAEKNVIQRGLFEDNLVKLYLRPSDFFHKYPNILKGTKKIIFVSYINKIIDGEPAVNSLLRFVIKEIIKNGKNPNDYIVTLVDKTPRELESFFEYIVCKHFSKRGMFTDSQIPFYYGVGTPDAAAYNIQELSEALNKVYNLKSCSTIELMLLNQLSRPEDTNFEPQDNFIVFEMKTTSKNGSQIVKYIDKNIFDEAFEVIPDKRTRSDYAGLINFIGSDDMKITPFKKFVTTDKKKYKKWLNLYFKMIILSNLENTKFQQFCLENKVDNYENLYVELNKITYEELLTIVKEAYYGKDR